MKHYSLQTNLSAKEIHERLGFSPSWEESLILPYNKDMECIYIMSIYPIENKSLDEYSLNELKEHIEEREMFE